MLRLPQANGIAARTGLIQCTSFLAVHANQKTPILIPKLPAMAPYKRCSGATWVFPSAMIRRCSFMYNILSNTNCVTQAINVPSPTARKTRPLWLVLKPYTL